MKFRQSIHTFFTSSNFLRFASACLIALSVGCNQKNNGSQTSTETAPDASAAPDFSPQNQQNSSSIRNEPLTVVTASNSQGTEHELQTASLTHNKDEDYSLPVSGTPEWDIRQISLLIVQDAKNNPNSENSQNNTALNIVSDDTARRIIALASHAISETHQRPEKELIFNAAIQSLMDARLKLAISGDKESLDAIYEDASTIATQRPGSTAAVIAAGTVVQLAREMAHLNANNSPWMSEYVRQVKLFSTNFSSEEARAIVQLTEAGEFCEQRQLYLEAVECHTMIQQQFPQSPFRKKADAALNRLALIGKTISLQAPTIDGKTLDLSTKKGSPVVLAFWSARSEAFRNEIPLLNQLTAEAGIQIVGINLDTQGDAVKEFINVHHLGGEHIFYPDFSQQGASQPLARQFGINIVPSYWYIDAEGTVRATNVSSAQLSSLLKN